MNEKRYTKTEFRHLIINCGYASSGVITEYFKQNPKPYYTEEDIIPCYRLEGTYTGIKKSTKRKS